MERGVRQSTGCKDYEEAKRRAEELSRTASIKSDAERLAVTAMVAIPDRSVRWPG
jgi:hypothetical protein